MFSNIIPIDGFVGLRRVIAASSRSPGLAWGKSEVSDLTRDDISATYSMVESRPLLSRKSRAWGHRFSGRSPNVNSASVQLAASPALATASTSSGSR